MVAGALLPVAPVAAFSGAFEAVDAVGAALVAADVAAVAVGAPVELALAAPFTWLKVTTASA